MLRSLLNDPRRVATSMVSAALFSLALSGCGTTAEHRYANAQEDAGTCQGFGAAYGSPAYSNCMLEQQRRRDDQQLRSLEQTRLTTEIAANAQVAADRARRDRCRRDPDRRECGR